MNIFTRVRRLLMLTCEDVNTFLVEYIDGTLDERTQKRFERHVASCAKCRTFLEQYRTTIELAREDRVDEEAPPELVEHTLAFLREELDT